MSQLRETFDTLDVDHANAKLEARGMRLKADDAPTQDNLDAAKAALETQAALCRQFRNWCTERRDHSPTLSEEELEIHEDIVKRLLELEAECPHKTG